MLESTKLAYLAGLIDGEGCFGAYYNTPKHAGCQFVIGSKDEVIVKEVVKLLASLNVPAKYGARRQKNGNTFYTICLSRANFQIKLIDAVLPYLVLGSA